MHTLHGAMSTECLHSAMDAMPKGNAPSSEYPAVGARVHIAPVM